MQFIVEHLDPEVYPWSLLEYTHLSSIVGKEHVSFTNVKKDKDKLNSLGKVTEQSVRDQALDQTTVCILDPLAEQELSPEDAEQFTMFLFGGVLGNDPMDGRTEKELSRHFSQAGKRSLGNKQMSTDTAVHVVHEILVKKKKLNELMFVDDLEIVFGEGYSQILPYRYLIKNDCVVLTPGLTQYLKEEDEQMG